MAPINQIFKDYFSSHAGLYAQARPTYPEELFKYLSSLVSGHDVAWDCATGNGQAAVSLKKFFNKIIATDASESQIRNAMPAPGITYAIGTAENSGLADNSVDLITVATALHWLNQEAFYKEADRVLKPDGILAVWTYGQSEISPEIDAVVQRYTFEVLHDYWPEESNHVWEGYKNLSFPYDLQPAPPFESKAHWDLHNLLNYLSSWSGSQRFIAAKGYSPLQLVLEELKAAWGDENSKREVTWKLYLKAGRKKRQA